MVAKVLHTHIKLHTLDGLLLFVYVHTGEVFVKSPTSGATARVTHTAERRLRPSMDVVLRKEMFGRYLKSNPGLYPIYWLSYPISSKL